MKKRGCVFILLVGMLFFASHSIIAQTKAEWQPIFLQLDGRNVMNGIEAYFQVATCNDEDVVFVKFINHNNYSVKLEWYDAVFTQELKWVNKTEPTDKKSLTIAATLEAEGECSANLYPDLIIKMKNFVTNKKNFKHYSASQLSVTAVQ